jgi:anti-sigma B factor antagonist
MSWRRAAPRGPRAVNWTSERHLVPPSEFPTKQKQFDVQVDHDDGVVVVRPIGELDLHTAPVLREILEDLRKQKASVLLVLKALTFMDSTGLRLIWDADVASRADGLDLTLTVGPPEVMRVFDLTGLTRRLPFVDLN